MARFVAAAVVLASCVHALANKADRERVFISIYEEKNFVQCGLALVDGTLGFLAERETASDDEASLPSIPADDGRRRIEHAFCRDGDTLQINVDPREQELSKTQAEKHLWYLSAKYTNKGAEVILTKEKTKYSHWEFVSTGKGGTDVEYFYIRNVNDLGKDAWLGMGTQGRRFKVHEEVRPAIISFDKKQEFGIEGGAHSGGK